MAVGIDLFELRRNEQTESQFDQSAIGGSLRVGYQITDTLRQTFKYTLRRSNT